MKRLFINADDFGLTDGVSAGIALSIEGGAVSATTAMMCVPGALDRVSRHAPRLVGRVGLHLQLTGGVPCLPAAEVPSLVGPEGAFPRRRQALSGVRTDEVEREFRAQVARMRALGVSPSHLDSHHHVHTLPSVLPAFVAIARELGVPARSTERALVAELRAHGVACADLTETAWFGGDLSRERLLRIVAEAFDSLGSAKGAGTVELMTHPGHSDEALAAISSYTQDRSRELSVLLDPLLAIALADLGVELIGPSALVAA